MPIRAGHDIGRSVAIVFTAALLGLSSPPVALGRPGDPGPAAGDGNAGTAIEAMARPEDRAPAMPGAPQRSPVAGGSDGGDAPAAPASAPGALAGPREKPELMGRFGRNFDVEAAKNGLLAVPLEPATAATPDPETTTAIGGERRVGSGPEGDPADADAGRFLGGGRASWYEHPGRTANGEAYDPDDLTAAHHSLPFGTRVKVVNRDNSRSVVVRITDRTNEHTKAKRDYAIDLSRESARELGIEGIGWVDLYRAD